MPFHLTIDLVQKISWIFRAPRLFWRIRTPLSLWVNRDVYWTKNVYSSELLFDYAKAWCTLHISCSHNLGTCFCDLCWLYSLHNSRWINTCWKCDKLRRSSLSDLNLSLQFACINVSMLPLSDSVRKM